MKKKLAMLLTAAMLVGSLAACGSSDNGSSATGSASATDSTKTDAAATEVSTEGKQLTVQIGPDPETIDPALNSAVDGGNMLLHSFECLLTIDQDGKIAPLSVSVTAAGNSLLLLHRLFRWGSCLEYRKAGGWLLQCGCDLG